MIHFIQPFSFEKNIGKAYNEAVKDLDGWICITDQDTLKFEGFANRVKQIVDGANKNQIITCSTNRLRRDNMNVIHELYNEPDINVHYNKFNELWEMYGTRLEPTNEAIAGVFMLFHKTAWEAVPFIENAINFDRLFTSGCKNKGFKPMVAKGLYIFHLYRWGRDVSDISHLIIE